ncbi:MAG: ribonuclease HII, partial [Polymorphobacter sp.]
VGVGIVDVEEIDRINILQATYMAMKTAVDALAPDHVLVDGNRTPLWHYPSTTLVGGDGRCLSIAAASIIAKVTRDRIMAALAADFPGYGWATNKGYGTAEHDAALDRLGVTVHHRRSYAPVAKRLARV